MKPTLVRILIFALLVGLCPVPVSDFLIGIGFAPVSFVLFWIGLGFVSFPDPLHLIYLMETVLYLALFWFLAGRVSIMSPRPRRLLAAALLAGSIPLWFSPIHIRIEQATGKEKPLAALFADEYKRFRDLRALRMPAEPMIYRPPQDSVHTRTVAPQIQSKSTVRPEVVQQPALEVTVERNDD